MRTTWATDGKEAEVEVEGLPEPQLPDPSPSPVYAMESLLSLGLSRRAYAWLRAPRAARRHAQPRGQQAPRLGGQRSCDLHLREWRQDHGRTRDERALRVSPRHRRVLAAARGCGAGAQSSGHLLREDVAVLAAARRLVLGHRAVRVRLHARNAVEGNRSGQAKRQTEGRGAASVAHQSRQGVRDRALRGRALRRVRRSASSDALLVLCVQKGRLL